MNYIEKVDNARRLIQESIQKYPRIALRGYRSLGCAQCTSAEADEYESEREGRWKGTPNAKGECGIHTCSLRAKK